MVRYDSGMPPSNLHRRERIRRPLRSARAWPPLNAPLTSALRCAVRRAGKQPAWLARYLPRTGLVEATLPNGRSIQMWSLGDDDVATMLFWRGWDGHEPETSPFFFDCARTSRITLDIGAHVGYFALLAALANPNGHVHAFEPLSKVHERLARNVSLNSVTNISCSRLALGKQSGRADFFHVDFGIPSTSSLSEAFMRGRGVNETDLSASSVEVMSVDSFVEENDLRGVDLVKIDTEGTEDDVLAGMERTIERDRPTIVCEVLPGGPGQAIEETLSKFDYRYRLLTPDGAQPRAHVAGDAHWRNYVFCPAERA